jgi:hypothetical protein
MAYKPQSDSDIIPLALSAQLIAQRFSCPAPRASDRSFREGRRRILEHEGEHCVRQRDAAKSPRVRAPSESSSPCCRKFGSVLAANALVHLATPSFGANMRTPPKACARLGWPRIDRYPEAGCNGGERGRSVSRAAGISYRRPIARKPTPAIRSPPGSPDVAYDGPANSAFRSSLLRSPWVRPALTPWSVRPTRA